MSSIRIEGVTKIYKLGHTEVPALRGVDLAVNAAEIVGIVGPSGSGKSTLLNIAGCIDTPTSGRVFLDEIDLGALSDRQITNVRRGSIGFIFQSFNLIPVLTAFENVELPLVALGYSRAERRRMAEEILERVGLCGYLRQRPDELSGGQRQRVAIARALVISPALVLADEPTANLDGENGRAIMEMMHGINHELSSTFLLATHDPRVLPWLDRRVYLEDGRISRIEEMSGRPA
jgi:putative ABC transport system ATP-binding protein